MNERPEQSSRITRSGIVTGVLLACLLLGGCGDETDDPPERPDSPPPATPAPVPRVN